MLLNIMQAFGISYSLLHPIRWDNGYASWLIRLTGMLLLFCNHQAAETPFLLDATLLQSYLFRSVSCLIACLLILFLYLASFAAGFINNRR